MTESQEIICNLCGKVCEPEGISAGYGIHDDLGIICLECAGKEDEKDMDRHGHYCLYLYSVPMLPSGEGVYMVSNWPQTLSYLVDEIRFGDHNICGPGSRADVWFTDHGGFRWHGVRIGNTEHCWVRRLKRKGRNRECLQPNH
jgi:hypothetical protein